ncbi:MAG: DUF3524 domain-containing protein [Spirochaetales bacterium]|nr:DUF3524 domain-containing protein [Spirochaetales bacterium]
MKGPGTRVLFIEGFYGGSHRYFARGFAENSRHRVTLATMPARYWKWRLKSSAYHILSRHDIRAFDVIFATSMTDVSQLKALAPGCPPVLLYMHENQLTYPRPEGAHRDMHLEMAQVGSCLAADRILFNSRYHKNAFFSGLKAHLDTYPEYRPSWITGALKAKAGVLYPGIGLEEPAMVKEKSGSHPAHVIWNHRWEFDKQPKSFFYALNKVKNAGIPFRLSLLGEPSIVQPEEFLAAKEMFRKELVHFGYVPSRTRYRKILENGDILVSTAIQENFGISVMEGIHAGLFPLLPDRLSYPELIPKNLHPHVLYKNRQDLAARLAFLCSGGKSAIEQRTIIGQLQKKADGFSWRKVIEKYDDELSSLVNRGLRGSQT